MVGRYQAYTDYKPSGVEWLGDIPTRWGLLQSRRMFDQRKERARIDDEQLTSSQKYGVIPQKKFMELENQKVMQVITGSEILKHVEPDDFVISMRSFQGGLEYCGYSGCVSSAYVSLIPRKHVVPAFFTYLFKSKQYIQALQRTSNLVRDGQALRFDNFAQVPLPIVPELEQTQIAAFLDHETAKIDALIDKQERLIALLEEKRQAVISHAVTKGLNPDAPMRPSGIDWLGGIPAHWKENKLGRLAFMQEGPGLRTWQFKDDGVRVICVTNITEGGINFSLLKKFISPNEYKASYRHFSVRKHDLLISSSGNSWGKVAAYKGDEVVILNTSTIRLNELPHSPLKREFLQYVLKSSYCREQLDLAMTGACQPNFGPTHLSEVRVAVPPEEEQSGIAFYLSKKLNRFDAPIKAANNALILLAERRTALISAAVTGKIDVRDWQPPTPTTRQPAAEKESA